MMDYDLTKGKISTHIKRIAIPASVGWFFNTMFNVVDTFFAGKLGTASLAGMSMSFPIFFIVIALSSGFGTGTTALISNSLGAKDTDKANQYAKNALLLSLIMGAVITIFGNDIGRVLFGIMGATGDGLNQGLRYINTIFLGAGFFILNGSLNSLLVSQGDTVSYRNFLTMGFVLNCLLDPLFIYGWLGLPKMGTKGVALATIIIQVLGMIYLTYKVAKSHKISFRMILKEKIELSAIIDVLKQGIPSSLNMMTIAIGIFVINFFIIKFGGEVAAAAYGASVRIEQIALLPALGLNIATLTLVGQNYGAKEYYRIKEIYKTSIKYGVAIMTTAMVIIYPISRILVGFFNNNPDVVSIGSGYLRIEFLAFNTYVLLNISISLLQGLKKPIYAIYIGIYRQILMPLLVFPLFGQTLGLGLKGIWWGIVVINWSAVFIIGLVACYNLRKLYNTSS